MAAWSRGTLYKLFKTFCSCRWQRNISEVVLMRSLGGQVDSHSYALHCARIVGDELAEEHHKL